MKKRTTLIYLAGLLVCASFLAFSIDNKKPKEAKSQKEIQVEIHTNFGVMTAKLYNETPLHRDNFVKLSSEGFYDSLLFHRVIKNFMMQGGDPVSKNAPAGKQLGMGGPGYTVPAEILPQFKHKKGALAAARMGDAYNPTRASSGSQFYIVHNANGTPHLDGQYSVFGEITKGFEVIDAIAQVQTLPGDRPVNDVIITKIVILK